MKGYTQINVIYANKLYRRPSNQYENDSSMTNIVHDTNLMPLVFLDLKKPMTFGHMKQLLSKKAYILCVKIILVGQVFNVLLTNECSLSYNQNNCSAFFSRHKCRLLTKCCDFKVRPSVYVPWFHGSMVSLFSALFINFTVKIMYDIKTGP